MTVEEVVSDILERHEDARDSDTALYYYYLKEELGVPLKPYHKEVMQGGACFESLSRTRRHIQNDLGVYPSSETVKTERDRRETEIRQRPQVVWEAER